MSKRPNFADCVASDEKVLEAGLASVRNALSHPGEKGSAVEHHVRAFLRGFLPAEYGLTSGFVAYHDRCITGKYPRLKYHPERDRPLLSTQLDIIVYDALRYGPLIRFGSCDVMPLEAVYAYVEVKTSLNSPQDLRRCLRQAQRLRAMQTKFFLVPRDNTYTEMLMGGGRSLMSIRSYVFALDASKALSGFLPMREALQDAQNVVTNGFLSGMYVRGCGHFRSHPCETDKDPRKGTIEGVEAEQALLAFKLSLLSGLARFPRTRESWSPALSSYYQPSAPQAWIHEKPLSGVPSSEADDASPTPPAVGQ